MKRILTFIAAAFMTVGYTASAQENRAQSRGDILIEAQFAAAIAGAQSGDADLIIRSLTPAMEDGLYAQLSKQKQYEVAELYGRAAYGKGHWAAAHRAFVRASDGGGTDEDWSLRLQSAVIAGDSSDAWLAFRRLSATHQPFLEEFAGRQINRLDTLFRDLPDAPDARLALGREMVRENWEPALVSYDPSMVWLHYVEALLEKGDQATAKTIARKITDPVIIMTMRADRRFDGVVAADAKLKDPNAAAQRYLQWARGYAHENPRMLSGRIAVIRALVVLNMTSEAQEVADDTARSMAHGSHTSPAFDDMDETWNFEGWKDSVLVSRGRTDEAIGGLTAETSCNCSVQANVQLGRTLMEVGRPRDAQRWLIGVNEEALATDDRMALSQTRACVAAQLDDKAALSKELEFLNAHEAWKPQAIVGALVCADRPDEAATILTRQLRDPRGRLTALSALQTYAVHPGAPKYAQLLSIRWAKLAAMPLVQAEVAKVGRINRFDLQSLGVVT